MEILIFPYRCLKESYVKIKINFCRRCHLRSVCNLKGSLYRKFFFLVVRLFKITTRINCVGSILLMAYATQKVHTRRSLQRGETVLEAYF